MGPLYPLLTGRLRTGAKLRAFQYLLTRAIIPHSLWKKKDGCLVEEQTAMDLEKHIQKREEDMKETEKAPCDQE